MGQDLGNIEVPERTEQHMALDLPLLSTQQTACYHQHTLDGTEPPVIVLLRRQQVLQKVVQAGKLLCKHLRFNEALQQQQQASVLAHHYCKGPSVQSILLGM